MKLGCITSILSASANHVIVHHKNHFGFLVYHHCLSFRKEEMICTFLLLRSFSNDEIIELIMVKMGGVPLQVQELLSLQGTEGPKMPYFEKYEGEVMESIAVALDDFKWWDQWWDDKCFPEVTRNACHCLLLIWLAEEPHNYDCRYSMWGNGYLEPLFPLVSNAYQGYFWKDLLQYVEEENEKGSSWNLSKFFLTLVLHKEIWHCKFPNMNEFQLAWLFQCRANSMMI